MLTIKQLQLEAKKLNVKGYWRQDDLDDELYPDEEYDQPEHDEFKEY